MAQLTTQQKKGLRRILTEHGVAAAYLFGSQAHGTARPDSDVDVAVLYSASLGVEQKDATEIELYAQLSEFLETDTIDLIDLDRTPSPLLKQRVTTRGQLLVDNEPHHRQAFERRVFHEYEDTKHMRAVRRRALQRHLADGTFGKPRISPYDRT